jgi:hypothetical protein
MAEFERELKKAGFDFTVLLGGCFICPICNHLYDPYDLWGFMSDHYLCEQSVKTILKDKEK